MPERLHLSMWLRGFDAANMLRHFAATLQQFPFSRLRPGIQALRVYAIEEAEPPAFEHLFAGPAELETVLELASEFHNPDCAYLVEGWWELWQHAGGWRLAPALVTLGCFGPRFENDLGDHLRIEFASMADFLPPTEIPGGVRAVRSNIRGLLRLARELGAALPLRARRLWTESGEDLTARLEQVLEEGAS